MTPLGAGSAGMACPACGVGTPAALQTLIELAPALRRVGRADEADAVAKQALDQATSMSAHALVRRLAETGGPGASGVGPRLDGRAQG